MPVTYLSLKPEGSSPGLRMSSVLPSSEPSDKLIVTPAQGLSVAGHKFNGNGQQAAEGEVPAYISLFLSEIGEL